MFDKIEEIVRIIEHLKKEEIKDTRNIQQVYEFICDQHAKIIIETNESNNNILAIMIHLNTSLTSPKWKDHLNAVCTLLKK